MTINLGIYDFFSYFIPGLLYLFVANEVLRIMGWKYVDLVSLAQPGQTLNIIILVPILIVAYVVGHIFDAIANRFLYGFIDRLRRLPPMFVRALLILRERHPQLPIKYEPKDWAVLYTLIRQRNNEITHYIDKNQADSKMLRNIALGSFILSLLQFGVFLSSTEPISLLNGLGAFLLFLLAFWRSAEFRLWFFLDIFEASLEYGLSLKDVVEYNYKKKARSGTKTSRKLARS